MEVYAAMVDRMDQGIGRIVDALKRDRAVREHADLFLQDNGGCAEGMGRGPKAAADRAATLPPLSQGLPPAGMIPKQTRDGCPVRQGTGVMPGAADTYIGYGEAGPTCPTRRSANTSTGSTKAASPRR